MFYAKEEVIQMKKYFRLVNFSIILFVILSCAFTYNIYCQDLYSRLKEPEFDQTKIAEVENIIFQRDVATFNLDKGTIYFYQPVSVVEEKFVTGALFIGKGTFSFTPPTKIEKEQLARFFKEETFEQSFKVLFLRFADTTFSELEKKLTFQTASLPDKIYEEIGYCEKYLFEERNEDIIHYLIESLTMELDNGYFYAHIDRGRYDPVFFIYNPHVVEEVSFRKRLSHLNYVRETINKFHKQEDYEKNIDFDEEIKDIIAHTHYKIETTIESNGDFSAKVNMSFEIMADQINILHFLIAPKLKVEEVLDNNGSPLYFIKEDKSADLTVLLDSPLKMGDKANIFLSYHGDILERKLGNFYIKSSVHWYPRFDWRTWATYDLTFKTPEKYEFVSIGKKIEDRKEGKYRISRWVQETPVVNASFNLGLFKTYDINIEGSPPVTVLMSDAHRREIALFLLEEYGVASGKNMEKQVGADIANSIQLFSNLFGPYPFERIYVTETPYLYEGQAFPGLLHLSWLSFQIKDLWGKEEIFRAHEVAHQWWGIAVGYKTYHDKWLSEGFAEYSGLWYMQWIKKDNKRFFQILDEWKNDIFSNRKYVLGSGAEAGPIWLGPRTSSSETRGDYSLIVYKKGAYVLHMLRNMLIDLKTMNEDRFENLLKDFFRTYKGKDASTEDFKRIVEKHCGENMDWFFNQWIYGTDIPTYKFSYYTSEKPDGKYLINCRVVQEDVPDDFKMYVPMTIKFKGDQFAHLRITVDKPIKEFSFPSPMKPEKIIFNEFNSVLAKVKYVKY